MSSLPIILFSATRHLHQWIREIAYQDMARQAVGWVPDDLLVTKPPRTIDPPIQIDLNVTRKNRLGWAQKRANHLPH